VRVISPAPEVVPYRKRKSTRGRKETVATQGLACLDETGEDFGVVDEDVHALVGYGKQGEQKNIQRKSKSRKCCGIWLKGRTSRFWSGVWDAKRNP
jgi:hypothetical protein